MKVTLNINASGKPTSLAKVLRQIADELEEAGDQYATGVRRVLMDGDGEALGEMSAQEAKDEGGSGN